MRRPPHLGGDGRAPAWRAIVQVAPEVDGKLLAKVLRAVKSVASPLSRENVLYAGSDQGGTHWDVIASLIEACKLNRVDSQAYLADVLSRLVNRHSASQIDQLMPGAYADPAA